LVDERIRVMVTSRGITDTTVYDVEAFRARFGFDPARLPDFKGLTGDPTDNLPGVPGVGEKTARQLIQKFGTLDALLERLDQVPEKLREALRVHIDQVRDSRRLATIVTDAPVRWTWEDLRRRPPDRARLAALLADLEFKSLLERLGAATEGPAGQYRQVDADALAAAVAGADEVGLHLVREP
ncbi:MAG: 5'-3' exonuclease H3TH domain-containing protein, partial [bacterium]